MGSTIETIEAVRELTALVHFNVGARVALAVLHRVPLLSSGL